MAAHHSPVTLRAFQVAPMDLNNILSQLETASEEDIEKLLQQYNVEVSRAFARFSSTKTNARANVS